MYRGLPWKHGAQPTKYRCGVARCSAPGCMRFVYALGMCKSHHHAHTKERRRQQEEKRNARQH